MMSISSDKAVEMLLATTYDFSPFQSVVEIGNGSPATALEMPTRLLLTILKLYPSMRGCIFDRPWVVEALRGDILKANLSERCLLISGNIFDLVPASADACLLVQVLGTLKDEQCIQVLKNCRSAMRRHGRVLVLEPLPHPASPPSDPQQSSTQRGVEEFAALFAAAGLRLARSMPTPLTLRFVEAVPA